MLSLLVLSTPILSPYVMYWSFAFTGSVALLVLVRNSARVNVTEQSVFRRSFLGTNNVLSSIPKSVCMYLVEIYILPVSSPVSPFVTQSN